MTPDVEQLAQVIRHRLSCRGPAIREKTGRKGDRGIECASCRAVAFPGWNPNAASAFRVDKPEEAARLHALAGAMRHLGYCPEQDVRWFRGRLGNLGAMCRGCGVYEWLDEPERRDPPRVSVQVEEQAKSRYELVCASCDVPIYTDSPKARVPLCERCKAKRGRPS